MRFWSKFIGGLSGIFVGSVIGSFMKGLYLFWCFIFCNIISFRICCFFNKIIIWIDFGVSKMY